MTALLDPRVKSVEGAARVAGYKNGDKSTNSQGIRRGVAAHRETAVSLLGDALSVASAEVHERGGDYALRTVIAASTAIDKLGGPTDEGLDSESASPLEWRRLLRRTIARGMRYGWRACERSMIGNHEDARVMPREDAASVDARAYSPRKSPLPPTPGVVTLDAVIVEAQRDEDDGRAGDARACGQNEAREGRQPGPVAPHEGLELTTGQPSKIWQPTTQPTIPTQSSTNSAPYAEDVHRTNMPTSYNSYPSSLGDEGGIERGGEGESTGASEAIGINVSRHIADVTHQSAQPQLVPPTSGSAAPTMPVGLGGRPAAAPEEGGSLSAYAQTLAPPKPGSAPGVPATPGKGGTLDDGEEIVIEQFAAPALVLPEE